MRTDIRPESGDLYVFCTDGIHEAERSPRPRAGTSRLMKVIDRLADQPAQAIVDEFSRRLRLPAGLRAPRGEYDGGGGEEYRGKGKRSSFYLDFSFYVCPIPLLRCRPSGMPLKTATSRTTPFTLT